MLALAILTTISAGLALLVKSMTKAITKETTSMQAGEQVRQALEKAELALVHANQITVASSTFVEWIADIDQSPNYDPNAFGTNAAKPQTVRNYLNPDRDGDASTIGSAANSWQYGYNLKDDDEDGDGNIDVKERLYLSSSSLYLDMSVNGSTWGAHYLKQLYVNVSTFTLTYYGSYANIEVGLGKNIDSKGNYVIDWSDMSSQSSPLSYITQIHIRLGSSYMTGGGSEYTIESDVYPPMLTIKPYSQ